LAGSRWRAPRGTVRILVAVADPGRRWAIEMASRDLGHDCRSVSDAAQAWDAFQSHQPDVVISEWALPGLVGRQLHSLIRSHPRAGYTYLILVPPVEGSAQIVDAIFAGADVCLVSPFSHEDLEMCLIGAGRVTALHSKLATYEAELKQLREPPLASSPGRLSGLRSQGHLDSALELLDARVTRYHHRYCLALVHVDHFEAYRASHTLHESDEVLRVIGTALRQCARGGDAVFHYAIGEFLHVLPEQTLAGAHLAAERLMTAMRDLAIPDAESRVGVLTISVGLAILDPERTDSAQDVRHQAEYALGEAIRLGRNRVEASATAPAPGVST
jgi:diguanylate cyclase (GGDEF)-like protein